MTMQLYDSISPGSRQLIIDGVRGLAKELSQGVAGGVYGYTPEQASSIDYQAYSINTVLRSLGWVDDMFPANEEIYFKRGPGKALTPAEGGKFVWEITK